MRVETHFIGWNIEGTVALTVKHYKRLGDVIYYDNFSDDNSREVAEHCGADVRLFGRAGELDDQCYLDIKNHAWKRSTADWVIIVDDDEILTHENLEGELQKATEAGHTIFKTQGFNIHSDLMPKDDWIEIQTGENNENYSKLCVFNPQQVKDIRYNYGCHAARPLGNLIYSPTILKLSNYRDVGGVERLIARHKSYALRLSQRNKAYNLGHHFTESEESKRKQWAEFSERCGIL